MAARRGGSRFERRRVGHPLQDRVLHALERRGSAPVREGRGPRIGVAGSSGSVETTEGAMAPMAMAPVRLTEPMIRENGELRTATWDEALDRAAEGLRRAVERNPGWGAGVFSCSKATNEMIFVAQKFARQVLGTNNVDSCNRT